MERVLKGLPGVVNISDDIIIGAENEDELLTRVDMTLGRLAEHDLTVNTKKCEFLKTAILYSGHIFSEEGVSPDPNRIDAISALKSPTNVKELRSFLGMVTYCARFLPDFASITKPLNNLTRKGMSTIVRNSENPSELVRYSCLL